MYRNAIDAVMQIEAAEVTGLAIPIGGIIGIILAILFILLLCALLAFFLLRRKKKYYQDNSQQVDIDTPIHTPSKKKELIKKEDEKTITLNHVVKVEAEKPLQSAPILPIIKVDGNTSPKNPEKDININIVNIIRRKDESNEPEREPLIKPPTPNPLPPPSPSVSPTLSYTSSSSTSVYDAEYVGPVVTPKVSK